MSPQSGSLSGSKSVAEATRTSSSTVSFMLHSSGGAAPTPSPLSSSVQMDAGSAGNVSHASSRSGCASRGGTPGSGSSSALHSPSYGRTSRAVPDETTPGGASAAVSVNTPSTDRSLLLLPPAQTIGKSLTALASSTAQKLEEVWDEVGYNQEERASQLSELMSEFRRLCDTKIAEERGVAVTFRQTIADAKEEMRSAGAALRIPVDQSLLGDGGGQSLTDELATLEAALEGMRAAATAARADLEDCRDRLISAHEALGTELEERWRDVDSDLTKGRREEFHRKVAEMEEAVATRTEVVVQLLRDCQSLMKDLHIDVESDGEGIDLDRKIIGSLARTEDGALTITSVRETESCTGISSFAMDALMSRVSELSGEKRRRKARLTEMGAEIAALWEKLHVPEDVQRSFTESVRDLGMDTIKKGEAELNRLHSLKAEMIGNLIADARDMISKLWDETNANDQQRDEFQAGKVSDEALYTDDLLNDHEKYIRALQGRLEQMRPILKLIDRREDIIKERMQYEELQKDPERLQQRGAALTKQLMMEEKMARRIKKDLPKYTSILDGKLREWRADHGEEFLYHGESYLDIMRHQEDEWRTYKDRETQTKLKKKQEVKAQDSRKANGPHYKPLPGKKKAIDVHVHHGSGTSSRPLGDAQNRENRSRAPSRGRSQAEGPAKRFGTKGRSASAPRGGGRSVSNGRFRT